MGLGCATYFSIGTIIFIGVTLFLCMREKDLR